MLNSFTEFQKQKGQAVLEYILLLFVIVSIFLGIVLSFAGATQKFMDNYFGAYFQCLLETGELPSLGNDTSDISECNAEFQAFSFSDGRPPILSDTSSSFSEGESANSDDGQGGGSEGSVPGSYVPMGAGDGFGNSNRPAPQKIPLAKPTKAQTQLDSSFSGGSGTLTSEGEDVGDTGRQMYIPVTGRRFMDEEQEKDRVSITKLDEEEKDLREEKRVPAQSDKKKETIEDADTSLTLPDIFRYILIAAMIIALIVFLGGQVLQYQKSKDG